jgi:hypothetical protein
MHAVVLYQAGWDPTGEMAVAVAAELGCRALPYQRRPDPYHYELIVIGLTPWGLLDPLLYAYLVSGALRGKTVAFYASVLGPPIRELFQAILGAATAVGGARLYERELFVTWNPLTGYSEPDANRVQTWSRQLASEFPPPSYPRGEAGKRASQL